MSVLQEDICLRKMEVLNTVSFQMLENGDLEVEVTVVKLSTCKETLERGDKNSFLGEGGLAN